MVEVVVQNYHYSEIPLDSVVLKTTLNFSFHCLRALQHYHKSVWPSLPFSAWVYYPEVFAVLQKC
jgi:hypothetical protein